ncbi:ATP-dependent protease [Rubrobacter xylanophilus]|uniref:ATP-dependent protease n=1 Tax=Rubrobacter xylanophilus TaxID=49319 RepID=A0A510HFZ0_9ACTN|nr:YifB family Mg chelatase-like AAA ATPase [Rubrobacter xylanophilus]BBL78854.1 ATP-dependent protease [Rubrobacter xylanophilus]
MAVCRVRSLALVGIDALPVDVEVDMGSGLPGFSVVGLPDAAVQEARERVRVAISNAGYKFPSRKVIVNLAPANLRKEGAAFDLPIALGILAACGVLSPGTLEGVAVVGELSLDGSLRGVRGALSLADGARREGLRGLLVPAESAPEAASIGGIAVYAARGLQEAVGVLRGGGSPVEPDPFTREGDGEEEGFEDVAGQEYAKRALEVSAAGGHNVLMSGPPGSGKTMLARRLPGILPPLASEESIEVTKVHSAAGLANGGLIRRRPFRAPHHTISASGLAGGGTNPRPGEVSLAHHGVLFLDEFPEFGRSALEVLRQPLEDGQVTISRVAGTVSYPARVTLVCSMNPCPCGYAGDRHRTCRCTPGQIERYRARISGPLLDRIDLFVEVPRLSGEELRTSGEAEPSWRIRERVEAARELQIERQGVPNSALSGRRLREVCRLGPEAEALLVRAVDRMGLSGRAHDRILRVARTVADLAGGSGIRPEHLAEALNYRRPGVLDR